MNRMIVKITTLFIGAAVFTAIHAAFAYFGYVEEPVNVRSVGMGGAGTAYCTGGFSYYNPAAVATANNSFISVEFGKQWDLSRASIETAWLFEKWFFGASFQTSGLEIITTDLTDILGPGSYQESMFSLLAGWKTKRYAIAAAANGLYHSIVDENAYALTASGGISVSVLPGKLTAGAAIVHAGRLHRGFFDSTFSSHRDSMATSIRGGFQWRDTVFYELPVSLSADVVYSRNYEQVIIPLGIEVKPLEALAIRIGKRFNWEYEIASFGLGLTWENIAFDAAYVPTTLKGDIDSKWLMGFRYSLHRAKKKINEDKPVIKADTTIDTPPFIDTTATKSMIDSTAIEGNDATTTTVVDSSSSLPSPSVESITPAVPVNDTAQVIDSLKNQVEVPDSSENLSPAITDKNQNITPLPGMPTVPTAPTPATNNTPTGDIPEKNVTPGDSSGVSPGN